MSTVACPSCGVEIGEVHVDGCSLEICAYCGDQALKCHCPLVVAGIDPENYDDYDEIPDEMWEKFDAENRKYGGRIRWSGEFPGSAACRHFDFWCREDPTTQRFVRCSGDDENATEDLNRLYGWSGVTWNRKIQAWEYKGESCKEEPECVVLEEQSLRNIETGTLPEMPLDALGTLYGMYDLANGTSETSVARAVLLNHVLNLGLMDKTVEELELYRRNIVARVKGLS